MYAAPPVIETDIFARVPDRLRARQNGRLQSGVARDCFLDGLYLTDQGESGLHDPTGRLLSAVRVAAFNIAPQCAEPDRAGADTQRGHPLSRRDPQHAVWRVPLLPDGNIGRVGIFIQMSGGMGPDGIAMDAERGLAVCYVGMGACGCSAASGGPLQRSARCAGIGTTNAAYGGPERKTLYITESETGTILSALLDVPGKEVYSHM